MSSNAVVLPLDMPVGLRFCPTEVELIDHYLWLKLLGMDSEVDPFIAEVDIYKSDPWELPCLAKLKSNDNEWFFSSRRHNVSSKSKNSRRKTKTGYWKITGEEKIIKGCNGRKRILTFHENGVKPAKRTGWSMHEFYYPASHDQKPTCIICWLKYNPHKKGRRGNTPNHDEGEPSDEITSDLENPVESDVIPPEVHCHNEVYDLQSYSQPLYSPDSLSIAQMESFLRDHEMQAPCGAADESNKYLTEPEKLTNVGPQENNSGVTTDNLFNISSLETSSESSYPECSFSCDTGDYGVDGVNQPFIGCWIGNLGNPIANDLL